MNKFCDNCSHDDDHNTAANIKTYLTCSACVDCYMESSCKFCGHPLNGHDKPIVDKEPNRPPCPDCWTCNPSKAPISVKPLNLTEVKKNEIKKESADVDNKRRRDILASLKESSKESHSEGTKEFWWSLVPSLVGLLFPSRKEATKVRKEASVEGDKVDISDVPLEVKKESLLGHDYRKPVGSNIASEPYRAIGLLKMKYATKSSAGVQEFVYMRGTGTLVGRGVVLTAAHNLYSKALGGDAVAVEFYAGLHKDPLDGTYKSIASSKALTWHYPEEFKKGAEGEDYALVFLERDISPTTGIFSIGVSGPNRTVNVTGYPGDKSYDMYTCEGKVLNRNHNTVDYEIDTTGGQSGAPVWAKVGGANLIFAVHIEGREKFNTGTPITKARIEKMGTWVGDFLSLTFVNSELQKKDENVEIYTNINELEKDLLLNSGGKESAGLKEGFFSSIGSFFSKAKNIVHGVAKTVGSVASTVTSVASTICRWTESEDMDTPKCSCEKCMLDLRIKELTSKGNSLETWVVSVRNDMSTLKAVYEEKVGSFEKLLKQHEIDIQMISKKGTKSPPLIFLIPISELRLTTVGTTVVFTYVLKLETSSPFVKVDVVIPGISASMTKWKMTLAIGEAVINEYFSYDDSRLIYPITLKGYTKEIEAGKEYQIKVNVEVLSIGDPRSELTIASRLFPDSKCKLTIKL